jgi:hypothetical protein
MSSDVPLKFVDVDRLDADTIMVTFSDQTTSIYSVDQMLELIPLLTVSPREAAN